MTKCQIILTCGFFSASLALFAPAASAQSLPSEGAKSGSIFSGGAGGSQPSPYRSPVSPPADNAKRGEECSVAVAWDDLR